MCSCSSSRHRQFRWTALAGQCLLSDPASHGGMTSWHARKSQVLQAKHVTWTDHYQDAQTQTPSTAAHHDKSFTALSQHCQHGLLTSCEHAVQCTGAMNGLAKGCPAAMCPHLSAVAQQVQALWEGDGLRVGEYVVLCEGLVAAAAAGGDATLQSQACPR
jgi:hypothetical protein